ncbi:hypothetical protein Tco_1518519 [Tanacetum coccineum]
MLRVVTLKLLVKKQGNNYHQQENQRQEAAKVYVAAPTKGRGYTGNLPWCNRCKAHHQPGPYPPRCGTEARGMVHALVGGETNQNLNNMEDDINA